MDRTNGSTQSHFILLGFSDRPHLERVLFVVILVAYLLTLVGNSTIILMSRLDSRLHTPMYFFLTHLSFLDLSFTTSSIPQLLHNLSGRNKTISYVGCMVQLFLFLCLGGVECLLLAVMAYDRFVAVCKPLHYNSAYVSTTLPGLGVGGLGLWDGQFFDHVTNDVVATLMWTQQGGPLPV
ncbi:Hypothetical predicted protein [Marmota monax]|uniref:G-protein coupled receptors family 1 profile domain-containing protein n=1 Tax=Marmota monax TaxID=9995 RepID=A0A5E4CN49_MARMO|nr:hypothetical protein GHT09_013168 [Marmota monax]VTJ82352.1 Hypothetical predicted protein [Marmota monax]